MIVRRGHDKYGHYLMIEEFRAAMPDARTAALLSDAPAMLDLLEKAYAMIKALQPVELQPSGQTPSKEWFDDYRVRCEIHKLLCYHERAT